MVDYCLSGAVSARVDGTSVALGGPKQRCVLVVLLARHDSVVSIDRLIDAVWGEQSPPKALSSVRSYVANLRRVLNPPGGPQRLTSHPYGYQLALLDGDSVDLFGFDDLVSRGRAALVRGDADEAVELLDEALALWHGDPFGEFRYHEFTAPEAIRFTALRTTAIEARFDAVLHSGGGAELVPEIEAAVAEHPLQERLWGHLMLALHRANRTADAVQAFHRACAALEREIDARPGEELQSLFRQLRDGELRSVPVQQAYDEAAPPPFVGRDTELTDVNAVVGRAIGGAGGLLLITGESGIGKTSLAQAVADHAAGMTLAWAGNPTGVKLPLLWTWIQLLRQLGAELGEDSRRAVVRAVPGVVAALVPEWTGSVNDFAATGFALVEGIVIALRTMCARRPLLLVVDDLHQADPTTVNVLVLLATQFPQLPIQVIANWTFFGADRPMNRAAFERLLRTNNVGIMNLRGIDSHAAAHLVDAIADGKVPAAVTEQVWRDAGGNPFYIKEIARTLGGRRGGTEIPNAVAGVVGRRLSVLDVACRRVLAAAAVIGPEFDVADLADILDLSVSGVQVRLRPAYQTGLLNEPTERPGAYRFSHGLVRDALLAQLATTERTSVHAAIATARTTAITTTAYEEAIAAADHAWRAGAELNPDVALGILEAVVQRALNRSAYADITELTDRALQICQRLPAKPEHLEREVTLWLHFASAKTILDGQGSEAAAGALRRAFEIGQEVKGRSFYSAIALQCLMMCAYGRLDEAEVIATGLREQYEASGDPDAGMVSDLAHIMQSVLRGDIDQLIATGEHMMDTFPPPDTVTDPLHFFHPRAYCWMALGEATRGNRRAMAQYHRRAMHLAQSRGDVFNIQVAKLAYVECAAILGIVEGTAELADQVDREFSAAGSPQWAAAARIITIWARTLHTGDGDAQLAWEAFEIFTSDGTVAMSPMFLCLLADIDAHHGRGDSARGLLERAGRLADATGEHVSDRMIEERLAALAQARLA